MIGPFCTSNSISISSERVVLYGNVSTKKQHSSILKKIFVFQKICFKVKILKSCKISSDCYIKTCRSHKRRAILKIPSTVSRRTYALYVGFKMKPIRKERFSVLRMQWRLIFTFVTRSSRLRFRVSLRFEYYLHFM